jgi:DNA-binding IclR family transcriptional regulator
MAMNELNEKGTQLSGYQAPAVRKAFQLLKVVAGSRKELGISELAKRLGFSKSTTHGLIHALLRAGALDQSPRRKKFFLGPAIIDLAFKSRNYIRVGEQAKPILNALRDRISETVFLGMLSSSQGIIIATAEAKQPLNISSPPGTSIPLLAGAVGKVLLSQYSDRQATQIIRELGLVQYTPQSIVNEAEYLRELGKVRQQGYALDNEEYMQGIKAVAVSLGNYRGLPLAIWTVGFAGSMGDDVMQKIIQETLNTAKNLQSVLDGDGK